MKNFKQHPTRTFFGLLALLIAMIAIGNKLRQPKTEAKAKPTIKAVSTYKAGTVPRANFSAYIEKSGVVQIVSTTGGIVYQVNVTDGQAVNKGTLLVSLANNYYGGNALSLNRQLAEKSNQLTEQTYDTQKDLVNRQREIANQNASNFEKLRDITNQSIADTQNSINLNNEVISTLNTNIQNLSADPAGNASLILSSKQLLSQFQSANNQLNAALRSAQYQADTNNPPSHLADEQKNLAMKQLDIQDKSLDINREISRLQLAIARVNEATMYPAAPQNGIVEQVLVRPGQMVGAGTPLLVFSGSSNKTLKATVYLPKEIAKNLSKTEATNFYIGNKTVAAMPTYVSQEATNGNLYAAVYLLPAENYADTTDKSYVQASLPIGYPDTSMAAAFVPLDAIYQTQDSAWIYVDENNIARAKEVKLGDVFGSFVQVESGLEKGGEVILDRNVSDGDQVASN